MLTPAFVREMLLTSTETSINTTVERMNEQLWPYTATVLRRRSIVNDGFIAIVDTNTQIDRVVDVVAVLFDGTFIPRGDEIRLDAYEPSWRVAPASIPHTFLFSGETPAGYVRLYPMPSQEVDVNLIVLTQPVLEEITPWNRMYVALRSVAYVASSDPVRARVALTEFLDPLIKLIEDNVHGL